MNRKNILVTGVSKGLGLNITERLLNEGYFVYGISRTVSDKFEDMLIKYPDRLKFKSFDLSKPGDVQKLIFEEFIDFDTPLHGFVNNAAFAYDDIVTNLKLETLDFMYRVNVYSPMMLTKYAIRNMLLHKLKGSIVHISSISVHTGYKGLAMYASTKGALEAFSKNTAREWGVRKIRSNTLVAGFMKTEMSQSLEGDKMERIRKRTSLKSLTELESVSNTVEFLISERSKSITGQNIHVDSGTI